MVDERLTGEKGGVEKEGTKTTFTIGEKLEKLVRGIQGEHKGNKAR